jgi:PQQ-like domain
MLTRPSIRHSGRGFSALVASTLVVLTSGTNVLGQLNPLWLAREPLPYTPYAGLADMITDEAGFTYATSTGGEQNNLDAMLMKFAPNGSLVWTATFDSIGGGHEQSRCLAFTADGNIVMGGNTPGVASYADALVLKFNTQTGALIWESPFDWGLYSSDSAFAIAAAPDGSIYYGGSCTGDGGDCLMVKLDASGSVVWSKSWDGPALAPYSQESVRGLKIAPDGNLIMLTEGTQASNHPDFVVVKYNAADGSILWESNWGVNGYDEPVEMVLDQAGDIYVAGIGIDIVNKISTVKFRGSDGAILWQDYDNFGFHNATFGIDIDHAGGVYVTAKYDPDGNKSNQNDNFFILKHDAATGDDLWTFTYGANCLYCLDWPYEIRVDSGRHVLVLGRTTSPPYNNDQILFQLDPDTGLEVARDVVSGVLPEEMVTGTLIRFDQAENIYVGSDNYNANTGQIDLMLMKYASLMGPGSCYPDCDADGLLTIDDFICFQTYFALSDPFADCDADGLLTIDDFICFQTYFAVGC